MEKASEVAPATSGNEKTLAVKVKSKVVKKVTQVKKPVKKEKEAK
ncbi:MAG: hypothetical protein WC988_01995 [Patescibacteria group bacterium]